MLILPFYPHHMRGFAIKNMIAFFSQRGGVKQGVGKLSMYYNRWLKFGDYKILKLK